MKSYLLANWKLIIVFVVFFTVMLLLLVVVNKPEWSVDFGPVYYASDILLKHGDIYQTDNIIEKLAQEGHDTITHLYLYPPFLANLIYPLTRLPLVVAVWLWSIFNLACYTIGVFFMIRILPRKQQIPIAIIVLAASLVYLPFLLSIFFGQANGLVFLCLAGTIWLVIKDKKSLAGIFLGLGILIKSFPILLFFLFVAMKRWTIVISAIGVIFAAIMFTIISAGPSAAGLYLEYLLKVLPKITLGITPSGSGASLPVLINQLYGIDAGHFGWAILALLCYGLIYYFGWRNYIDNDLLVKNYAILIILILLLSSYILHHYYIWLAIPIIILIGILKSQNTKKYIWFLLILGFILTIFPGNHSIFNSDETGVFAVLWQRISFWGLMTILILLIKNLKKPKLLKL